MHPIQILLNKIVKCINFCPYRYSDVNSFFFHDNILKVEDFFKLELGKFIFNKEILPPVFTKLFQGPFHKA